MSKDLLNKSFRMGIVNGLLLLRRYAQMDQRFYQGSSIKQLQARFRIPGYRILIQKRITVSLPHHHLDGRIMS